MKKYTKRLAQNLHDWRVGKNYVAALFPIGAAINVLALHSSVRPIITGAIIGGIIIIIGETLFNIGMSWVETCESIQEKN